MLKDGDVFMSYRLVGKYFGAMTEGRRTLKNQKGECTISQGDLRIEMKGEVAEAEVNGKTVELNAAPFVEDFGDKKRRKYELMLPLESMAKIFSSEMKWDKKTNIVSITTPKRKIVQFDTYHKGEFFPGYIEVRAQNNKKEKISFLRSEEDTYGYDIVHHKGRSYVWVKFGSRPSGGYSAVPQRVYFVEGKGYYIASTLYEPYGNVTMGFTHLDFVIGFENKEELPIFFGVPAENVSVKDRY